MCFTRLEVATDKFTYTNTYICKYVCINVYILVGMQVCMFVDSERQKWLHLQLRNNHYYAHKYLGIIVI